MGSEAGAGDAGAVVAFRLDGAEVRVPDTGTTLLDALREVLGRRHVKDGCSPQGQCGCCTVLVDGSPRVSCVTPLRRVAGREVTTLDGLPDADRWAEAFCAAGASQCGFCTPGIIVRLAALLARRPEAGTGQVEQALAAHLCRCTGWQTIVDAWELRRSGTPVTLAGRDLGAAAARASLEGGTTQQVSVDVARGRAPFADDTAPPGALVAVPAGDRWVMAPTLAEARREAGKVQGRRTTSPAEPPLQVPPPPDGGTWAAVLRTSWVEPAYVETDASWCEPGGEPASPLANGGAFGGKAASPAPGVAARLAAEAGRPVRVVLSREDAVRHGPKRPPVAGGARADGTGVLLVVRTPGVAAAVAAVAPGLAVEEVDVPGPPTSAAIRAAGWAEAVVLLAGARGHVEPVTQPGGGTASAAVEDDGTIRIHVDAGDPLDEVVLRSYVIGAAHQALSWVTSEAIAVDADGAVHDLTIRSFGIVPASGMPHVRVEVERSPGPPLAVSDAAFAAVAAAVWLRQGTPEALPSGSPLRPGAGSARLAR